MLIVRSLLLFVLAAIAEIGGAWLIWQGVLLWGMVVDKFKPDRYDITGAVICLIGVVVIMYAPRGA